MLHGSLLYKIQLKLSRVCDRAVYKHSQLENYQVTYLKNKYLWIDFIIIFFPTCSFLSKLRMVIGNVSKRQQPDQRAKQPKVTNGCSIQREKKKTHPEAFFSGRLGYLYF